jgi:hypothetical protein
LAQIIAGDFFTSSTRIPNAAAVFGKVKDEGMAAHAMIFNVLNPRNRSLPRGTALVLGSLTLAFLLSGFPEDRASLKLLIPALLALLGTWDTMRCLQHRWSLYHGAVVVLIYMDIMALCMILFLLLYPYGRWLL